MARDQDDRSRRRSQGTDYHGEPEYRERGDPYMRRHYYGGEHDYGPRHAAADEYYRGRRMRAYPDDYGAHERERQYGSEWPPVGDYRGGYRPAAGHDPAGERFAAPDEGFSRMGSGGQGARYGAALVGDMYAGRPGGYRDYDPRPHPRQGRDYGHDERGFWDRASDEVASWFGNEEAEQRRRMDYRGRGPRGYTRSDERIREDVNDRLTDDWRLDASDIEVDVGNGEVTLNGSVYSRGDKRLAEDIVEHVSGVAHVQNNLRVKKWEEPGRTGKTL
jgi:osmotically-inducible protein OsmY